MLKRAFDIFGALVLFILLGPVMILTAVLVRIYLGSPVVFRQPRPGLGGKVFYIYKFRTMKDLRDSEGCLLSDEERLTKFGSRLRSTSLDELPELWNILKGEMSFVGPRPLLVEYLPLYDEVQRKRHDVRPGITGLAQVSGRNLLDWQQKFDLDVWYVEHQSFSLDVKILLKTLFKVINREGINNKDQAVVKKFKGNGSKC